MMNEKKSCVAIWFSGFFGIAGALHLVRFIARVPVTIGDFEVPLKLSALAAAVLGILSIALLRFACKPSCCAKDDPGHKH